MTPLADRSVEGGFTVTIRLEGVYRLYAPDLYPGGPLRYIADLAEQAVEQFSGSIVSGEVTSAKASVLQETNGYRASVVPAGEVA
jgi:hypothetical protein